MIVCARWRGHVVAGSETRSTHRYVIERALEWITRFRRLARRYDRIGAHFEALVQLACAVICYRRTIRTGVLLNNPN